MISETTLRAAGVLLFISTSACGSIATPASPSTSDFSSGNFSMNIVASGTCTTLPDAGRDRSWKIGLIKAGSSVSSSMQGWSGNPNTVFSQTDLAGTARGSELKLSGHIYDTVDGCATALCFRAEGTITATQTGNVINGSLDGVLTYEFTTCQASDHKVTFTRQ